jgi:hypothetical protein
VGKAARANEQLPAEAVGLKQRIEMLEQETQQLSGANKIMKRDIGEVSECCQKVRKDFTDLKQKLGKLKEKRRAMRLKTESFAPPRADAAVSPSSKSLASVIQAPVARKPPSSSSYSMSSSSISPPAPSVSYPPQKRYQ